LQNKKHGVREIVVSALRGQPGNTDFEAEYKKGFYPKKSFFVRVTIDFSVNNLDSNLPNYRLGAHKYTEYL
jgi:hypothetical protein